MAHRGCQEGGRAEEEEEGGRVPKEGEEGGGRRKVGLALGRCGHGPPTSAHTAGSQQWLQTLGRRREPSGISPAC